MRRGRFLRKTNGTPSPHRSGYGSSAPKPTSEPGKRNGRSVGENNGRANCAVLSFLYGEERTERQRSYGYRKGSLTSLEREEQALDQGQYRDRPLRRPDGAEGESL